MNDVAIRIENLGKRYQIGAKQEEYYTFRDTLTNIAMAPFRRLRRVGKAPTEEEIIWALKDVSFEVKHGEVVGIIGRNGAGKSTLLKILSRITEPTEGRVEVYGRIASLLEVGTGFHPELTGRENIFLNGAILGMKKTEIKRKFDEIVAFAEIEKFIDTPVKRYSSGMYVRLAFAVAAHMEPEILLVDEVLAVGDLTFQKKCLGKMQDVGKGGRTVLFVSHQMNSIRRLCESCIWLDGGRIRMVDSTAPVISSYEAASATTSFDNVNRVEDTYEKARFLSWEILEGKHEQSNILNTLDPVTFRFILQLNKPIRNGHHGIVLWNSDRQIMWSMAQSGLRMKPGLCQLDYRLYSLPLYPGNYHFQVSLFDEGKLLDLWDCFPELIIATDPLTHPRDEWKGILNIPSDFQFKAVNDKSNESIRKSRA